MKVRKCCWVCKHLRSTFIYQHPLCKLDECLVIEPFRHYCDEFILREELKEEAKSEYKKMLSNL